MITKNDHTDIVRMRGEGYTFQAIAEFYGTSRQNIFTIYYRIINPRRLKSGKRPFPELPRFFCQGLGLPKKGGGPKKSAAVLDFIKKNPHLVTKEVTE